MIRLTLHSPSTPSSTHLFDSFPILIGKDGAITHLPLAQPNIQPIHLKIEEEDGRYFLNNVSNDPFTSHKGFPFGKKELSAQDDFEVGDLSFSFEIVDTSTQTVSQKADTPATAAFEAAKDISPHLAPSKPQASPSFSPFSIDFESDVEPLTEEELKKVSITDWTENGTLSSKEVETPAENLKKTQTPLKDDYLKDLEDENQRKKEDPFALYAKEPSHLYQAWKLILLFIFSLLATFLMVGSLIYFTLSDKTEAQELTAAQGVADVAMALTHAQLNRLKPHNHNWSDVDFLKSNLAAILPETSSLAAHIDIQGKFNCCPYTLRIYTSSDLSHFLLIAQPDPSLLNWLIPQSLIVVDSHLMELRELKDVRGLNRLLANPDPLDGSNGREITALIQKEQLIHLSTLAHESGHMDFSPPKQLAVIHPGAENFIYNAPRYYHIGLSAVRQSMDLAMRKSSSQEVSHLKETLQNLATLNTLVLYSDQGKKSAQLAYQGFKLFAPNDRLLFGYFLLNAQGKIQQVHLVKEEELKTEESKSVTENGDIQIAYADSTAEPMHTSLEPTLSSPLTSLDVDHPVYIQLQALAHGREEKLTKLKLSLFEQIESDFVTPSLLTQENLQLSFEKYLNLDKEETTLLKQRISALYHEYDSIPPIQFLEFAKTLKLDRLIEGQHLVQASPHDCSLCFQEFVSELEKSSSFTDIEAALKKCQEWLNFDTIQDPKELLAHQNAVRNNLIEKLQRGLLSAQSSMTFQPSDRKTLEIILSAEQFIHPEEKSFFLDEFDHHFTNSPVTSEQPRKD